jgi:hypothetical protein
MKKKNSGRNNMIVLGVKQVLVFPNLFTYYEKDTVKLLCYSMIILILLHHMPQRVFATPTVTLVDTTI